ncbi:MAG: hypothetical protein AAF352_01295, partial [Pseudomonadota bacterium]
LLQGPYISDGLLAALVIIMGMTGIGWNGVFMASLAGMFPSQYVAIATAFGVFIVFLFGAFAPILYSLMLKGFGNHTIAMGGIALCSVVGVILCGMRKLALRS